MALILKCILGLFILVGIAITLYGLYQVLGTMTFVKDSPERGQATFVGYHREIVETTSTSPSTDWSHPSTEKSTSVMSYPCFEYRTKDGTLRQVCESKIHLIERFKRGQKVDIILHPFHSPRLAGFYSLYVRDLIILILGLAFIFFPLLIGKVAIPSLESPAGIEVTRFWKETYNRVASISVGPVSLILILKVFAGFMILILCIALVSSAIPFIQQLRLGTGWGLIEALQKKDFDVARELISKRKGIHKVNEYHQNPLLLTLEAGQSDLAKLLIEAGADVNITSKMNKTPLGVATQSGDLEMVRLLISKGASLDASEDAFPPLVYALMKGYDEIARVLIEAGTDLSRQYITVKGRLTVGDIALLARKPELVDLIRKRGGTFTLSESTNPRQ